MGLKCKNDERIGRREGAGIRYQKISYEKLIYTIKNLLFNFKYAFFFTTFI